MSKDFGPYKQLYDDLSMAFKDVFIWVEDVVSRLNQGSLGLVELKQNLKVTFKVT